jgi:iron complex outermembrane recepter protein
VWAGMTGLVAMSGPSRVAAQAAGAVGAGELRLEEVVVTARKREESLQDVPLSITAFTAESIEERGIESVYDLARLTPNLSFDQSYGRGVLDRPAIRGQSNLLGARTVSFVVDGVYIAGNLAADLDDVAQVEVLKGPQAATYGRAALAGVISYRTKAPSDSLTGKVSVTGGADGYEEVSAFVSGPIGETLGYKLGARHYAFDGQYEARSSDGRTVTLGAEQTQRVSGALRWDPSESFDVTMRAFFQLNDDGLAANYLFTDLNCFTGGPVATRGGSYCGRVPTVAQAGALGVDLADIERAGEPGIDQDTILTSMEANWRVFGGTLTAIAAWNKQDADWIFDDAIINGPTTANRSQVPGPTIRSNANPGGLSRIIELTTYRSQELRFASNSEAALDWIVGVYHYDESNRGFAGAPVYNGLLANGMLDPLNNGPAGTLRSFATASSPSGVDNEAVFASATWDATERLHLAIEGRYAIDTLRNVRATVNSFCSSVLEGEFKSFTPRTSMRFDFTEDANVYVSAARGNRPGSFNTALCGATVPEAEARRMGNLAPLNVREDRALTYELGTKLALFDGRMALDVTAFYIDWTNQQYNISEQFVDTNGVTQTTLLTTNAGATEVKGLEVNWAWRLNEFWDVSAGFGYSDAEFVKACDATLATIVNAMASSPACPAGPTIQIDVAGNQTGIAPSSTANAGLSLNLPLGDAWTFFARTDASYQGERYAEIYNHASTGSSLRFDARAGVNGDSWSITAWGRNVGNDRSATSLVRLGNPDNGNRAYRVNFPNGRQFGLTVAYEF